MKNIKYLFYIIAAVFTLGFASCSSEEKFEPGEADSPDCHQVSFLFDKNHKENYELDPNDPTVLTFKAKRNSDEGAITVPVVLTDDAGIFEVEPIEFEDGQEETEFSVIFDDAEIGTEYSCTISIEDPEYASKYTNEPLAFTFTINRVKWNKVVGKDGSETGLFREGFICDAYGTTPGIEVPVEVYERSDKPGLFKVINPYGAPMLAKLFGASEDQVKGNVKDTEFIINAVNPAKAWVPFQNIGCFLNKKEGWIYMASDVKENGSQKESYGFYDKATGVISFPKNGLLFGLESMKGKFFHVNSAGLTRLILPGGKAIDYSVSAQAGLSNEGKLPVKLLLGVDVATTKYACFEGSMSHADVPYKAKDIAEGKVEGTKEIEGSGEKAIELEFEKTGVYTAVFATFNDKGEFTGKSTSAEIKYVAAGDQSKKVILDAGLIVSNKHSKEGFTSENSAEVWISGQDIESINWGVFKLSDLLADQNKIFKELLTSKPMSEEDLANVNEGIFSGIVKELNSGTEYILLVYAKNGFEKTLLTAKATTEGKPDPRYAKYTANDFVEGLMPAEMSQFFGDYNLYAMDFFEKDQTQRAVLAQSTIKADSDTSLVITNMIPGLIKKGELYSSIKFDFLGGLLGSLPFNFDKFDVEIEGQKYYVAPLWSAEGGGIYGGANKYCLVASYVADGIIAFVGNPSMAENQKVVFNGVYCGAFDSPELTKLAGGWCGYTDYLLVRKDLDADKAQKKAEAVIAGLKEDRKPTYVDYSVNFLRNNVMKSNLPVNFKAVSVEAKSFDSNKEFKFNLKNRETVTLQ